jgi:crotonobetainyl-CoA:carnitine CoA-transferase CaiB-like acyl-CoA transferase
VTASQLLSGIRVVDLSRIIAGPWASQILSDFGADVIKIERPGTGDEARGYLRGAVDGVRVSPIFVSLNSGKRSVVIDLADAVGRDLLLQLIDGADVFLHNFRPGVVARLGLDEPTLRDRNPRLVYCAITGFGESGPLEYLPGNDIAGQAYGGLMSILGESDGVPIRCPVQVADMCAGYNAAIGILAALCGRSTSGAGANVGTSLFESVLSLMGQYVTDYAVSGVPMARLGSQNRFGQPNQAFPTADGYVVIAATGEQMWQRCTVALERPELAEDPRFVTQQDRVAHQQELAHVIEQITSRLPTAEIVERLGKHNVVAAPILGVDEIADHPQVQALGMDGQVSFDGIDLPVMASPVRIDGERPDRIAVPALGQHTDEILSALTAE